MKQIIFATGNENKMREIRQIMSDVDANIISMKEAGIVVDVVEDGNSFEENARIKARAIAEYTDAIVLADDSGLEIDYLDKAPGIYSARFMGEDTPYTIKNQALLDKLDGVEESMRTARFVCAIAAILPDKSEIIVRETMEGHIGFKAEGENGFGYDPIFVPEGFSCSSAVLSADKKNEISHRGKALRTMKEKILSLGIQ